MVSECGYILIKNNSNLKTGLKRGGALESLGKAYSLATESSWHFTLGSVSTTEKKKKEVCTLKYFIKH